MDRVFVEWLWRSVKSEVICLTKYESIVALCKGLKSYLHFYNTMRPHQPFEGATPDKKYRGELLALDGSSPESHVLLDEGVAVCKVFTSVMWCGDNKECSNTKPSLELCRHQPILC